MLQNQKIYPCAECHYFGSCQHIEERMERIKKSISKGFLKLNINHCFHCNRNCYIDKEQLKSRKTSYGETSMENMTKEQMEELREIQFNFRKSKHYLYEKAKEICAWEKENLRTDKVPCSLELCELKDIDFSPENHEGEICFFIYNGSSHEQEKVYIEEYKFYSNNWKEKALKDVSCN